VQPDQRQSQMLDDLGNAIVKASDEIRAHCQTKFAIRFSKTAREISPLASRAGRR
jgi:hypothetical protein